ncbi:hypothetical protein J3P77_10415 [Pseudomonas sp. R1-18]|uniref:hypothetical protein n=1 Tax=Pseudomonas sp. R1-18 TaxID=1632772 RepID=UPI003DA9CE5F
MTSIIGTLPLADGKRHRRFQQAECGAQWRCVAQAECSWQFLHPLQCDTGAEFIGKLIRSVWPGQNYSALASTLAAEDGDFIPMLNLIRVMFMALLNSPSGLFWVSSCAGLHQCGHAAVRGFDNQNGVSLVFTALMA